MGMEPQAPAETKQEKAYGDIGAQRRALAKQTEPVRKDLFDRLSSYRAQRQKGRNLSSVDATKAYKDFVEVPAATRQRQPGAAAQAGLEMAKGLASTSAKAGMRADKSHAEALQGLTAISLGEQDAAIDGMGREAERGLQEATSSARRDAARSRFIGNTVGSVAGVAGAELSAAKRQPIDGTPSGAG